MRSSARTVIGRGASVPPPNTVAASLIKQLNVHGEQTSRTDDENVVLKKLLEPYQILGSKIGQRVPDGPAIRIDHSLERPLISFISGRTDDDRTPSIEPNFEGRR